MYTNIILFHKTQYLEYEKKWLTWRDHLKQKCEVLKKKRELKMAEKKVNFLIFMLPFFFYYNYY